MLVELDIVLGSIVRRVEVVGVRGVLGSERVDALDKGRDAERLAVRAHGVLRRRRVEKVRDLSVREAHALGLLHQVVVHRVERDGSLEGPVHLHDVVELEEEPAVDLGQVVDLVHRVRKVEHRVRNRKETRVGRDRERVVEVLRLDVGLEAGPAGVDLADGLLQTLLESASDRHHLAHTLHRRAHLAVHVLELGEVPLGDLGDDVVERGLEARGRGLGHRVRELGEGVAERDLGGGVGERVAGRLGREGGRSRETSVHLRGSALAHDRDDVPR